MNNVILDASPDVIQYRVYVFERESDASRTIDRDGKSKKASWNPIHLRTFDEEGGKNKSIADISGMVGYPLFSQRAYEETRDVLTACGEFLPFYCGVEPLWGFNVTKFFDCLNESFSSVVRFPSSGRIMDIQKYVFREMDDLGICIFGIPQFSGKRIYTTEATRIFFQRRNITGMSFKPLP